MTRRWAPVDNSYKLTAVGKAYYRNKRTQYVVHVPVTIQGRRQSGADYDRASWMPIHRLGLQNVELPQNMSRERRGKHIRQRVSSSLESDVLHEESGETWTLDRNSTWLISDHSVQYDGQVNVRTNIEREIRMGTEPLCASHLPFPEDICPRAFEEHADRLCCPRQMARLLKEDFEEVCLKLDDCSSDVHGSQDWRQRGVSVAMLEDCARRHQPTLSLWRAEHCLSQLDGCGKALVAYMLEEHVYFYQTRKAQRQVLQRHVPASHRIAAAHESKLPAFDTWTPLVGEVDVAPGVYWTKDLAQVR